MYKLKQGKYNSCMFISTWSSLKLPVMVHHLASFVHSLQQKHADKNASLEEHCMNDVVPKQLIVQGKTYSHESPLTYGRFHQLLPF